MRINEPLGLYYKPIMIINDNSCIINQLESSLIDDARFIIYNCHMQYKHVTIINNDSCIVNKFETSLIDNARVIIYDCHMFIVQATALFR